MVPSGPLKEVVVFIVRQLPPLLTALFGDIRNRAENGLLKRAVIALCLGVENLL